MIGARQDWVPPFGTFSVRHHGRMRGAFTVDEPLGQRWDLALDLLSAGPDLIALGPNLLLYRDTGGPRSDGQIHIEVVATSRQELRVEAQSEVDVSRALVRRLAEDDQRFGSLLRQFGVIWDYVSDEETTRIALASIGEDGALIWPDR